MRGGYPCSLPLSRFQAGAVGQWSLTRPISVTNGRSISGRSKVYPQTEPRNKKSLHCSEGHLQVPSNFWNFPNDYSQHWRNQLCIYGSLSVSFISPHIPLPDILQNKKKKKMHIKNHKCQRCKSLSKMGMFYIWLKNQWRFYKYQSSNQTRCKKYLTHFKEAFQYLKKA